MAPQYARQPIVLQRRPEGLQFLVNGTVVAQHAYARPGIRLVQLAEHLPPKPQPRHERFVQLGDRVAESFGELGRRYVAEVERRAPHAPLAVLREVLELETTFERPIVAASLESLLQFAVIKRGALSRLCYRFGPIPKTAQSVDMPIPQVDVEQRALSGYDESAA